MVCATVAHRKGCLTTVAMERLARLIDPTVQQEMKLEDLEFACPALPEALEAKPTTTSGSRRGSSCGR